MKKNDGRGRVIRENNGRLAQSDLELQRKKIWVAGIRRGLKIKDLQRLMGYKGSSGLKKFIARNGLQGKARIVIEHLRRQVMAELIIRQGNIEEVAESLALPVSIIKQDIKYAQDLPIEERREKFKDAFERRAQELKERYDGGVVDDNR